MIIWFGAILLATILLGALYSVITNIDVSINLFVGYLQSIFCFGALSNAIEPRLRDKLRVLVGLIGLPIIIFTLSKIQPELERNYWIYVIVGTISIIGCFAYSLYTKEDTRLKKFIRQMNK